MHVETVANLLEPYGILNVVKNDFAMAGTTA